MLGFPVKFIGEPEADPSRAPTVGEHTDAVLEQVLGYDAARIAAVRAQGALG